jgi:hypothetical protein
VRYNPITGERVKVPQTDPRFDEWSNRKPSKRTKRRAAIAEAVRDPVAAAERVVAAAPSIAANALAKGAEGVALALPSVLAREARRAGGWKALGAALWPAVASLGAAAATNVLLPIGGLLAVLAVAKHGAAESRANIVRLSEELGRAYTQTRARSMAAYGVETWSEVPEAVRGFVDRSYLDAMQKLTTPKNPRLRGKG